MQFPSISVCVSSTACNLYLSDESACNGRPFITYFSMIYGCVTLSWKDVNREVVHRDKRPPRTVAHFLHGCILTRPWLRYTRFELSQFGLPDFHVFSAVIKKVQPFTRRNNDITSIRYTFILEPGPAFRAMKFSRSFFSSARNNIRS